MLRIDREAVLWSAAPGDRRTRPLLVLMHGGGGREDDLADLAAHVPPDLVTACLRAPLHLHGRWSWFDRLEDPGAVDLAARAVLDWLEDVKAPPRIGLLGFSQGGAVAMQLLRHEPTRFACVVQLAGFIPSLSDPRDAAVRAVRPAVFSGHGELDDVISAELALTTSTWLSQHTDLEEHLYRGLAHSISKEETHDVCVYLRRRLDVASGSRA